MRTYYIQVQAVNGLGHDIAVLVIGSTEPDLSEKLDCLQQVIRLVDDGWTIAAYGSSTIGQLTNQATTRAGGRFINLEDRWSSAALRVSAIQMAPQMSRATVFGGVR